MAQYIKKSSVVAEIKRRIKEIDEIGTYLSPKGVLTNLLCHLDTLEIKEVDLEKEVDSIWNPRFNLGWDEKSLLSMNHEGFTAIAKHFYELGLKGQKGE